MQNELYHYGVKGMKWGVIRSVRKAKTNERLRKRALNLDAKSAELYKKAEKVHAKKDLERSNRAANKAAKYAVKSSNVQKKANKQDIGELTKTRLERKAAKLTYKSNKARLKANRLSKETGYGSKAMKLSVKSDKIAIKAAKVRMKLSNNESYIAKTKQKVNRLSPEEIRRGSEYIERLKAI